MVQKRRRRVKRFIRLALLGLFAASLPSLNEYNDHKRQSVAWIGFEVTWTYGLAVSLSASQFAGSLGVVSVGLVRQYEGCWEVQFINYLPRGGVEAVAFDLTERTWWSTR